MRGWTGSIFVLIVGAAAVATAVHNHEANSQLLEVGIFRRELVRINEQLKRRIDIPSTMRDPEMRRQAVAKVVEDYANFGDKLDAQFPSTRERHLDPLDSIWTWAQAEEWLRNLDGLYTAFRKMQQLSIDSHFSGDENTWRNFSETILHDPNLRVAKIQMQIFDLIINDELFKSAYKLQEGLTAMCNSQQSPQQLLYNLYNSIAVTEIKGYAMMQFSWLLLKIYEQGNFTEEMELTNTRYEIRMAETLKAVQTAMVFASQDLWRCDPPYPGGPDTSTQLTWFVQSYIVNEVDLNDRNTCGENCAYYNYAQVHGCFKEQYCSKQRKCNGKLYNCQYVDSDMWICPAEHNSGRRYSYIEYENGRVLGQKGTCSRGTTKVDSWWRWLFWHCSYCLCFCDDPSVDSDRYFNLREVVTDIKSNKVITGLKFVKIRQVIHLQIEQGELLGKGKISNDTEWKPIDAYSPFNRDLIDGEDFFKLSWEKRAIDLDDLTAPPGHLLTGVRFRTLGSHLNFEIRITQFNFTTGALVKNVEESRWIGNSNTDASEENPRTMLNLDKPDISTRSELPSIPDSKSDQYIKFSPSDLGKDAAQSTVPFIDIQPVVPYPRIPIAGAGIYHKGRPGFGGFIAPKLRTYNFAPHLLINKSAIRPLITVHENVIGTGQVN